MDLRQVAVVRRSNVGLVEIAMGTDVDYDIVKPGASFTNMH